MCRRWSGVASLVVGLEAPPEITLGKELLSVYKSSDWGERCFCKNCGANLFHNAPQFDYYGVSAGALDNEYESKLTMDREIFIDKKPAFYSFEGDRPKLTEAEFNAMITGPSE